MINDNPTARESGLIPPTGEAHENAMQVYSGEYTRDFFGALVRDTEADTDMLCSLNTVFVGMFSEGYESLMIELLGVLHGFMGTELPTMIRELSEYPEARYCFLLFFLSDFGDCLDGHLMDNDPRIYE